MEDFSKRLFGESDEKDSEEDESSLAKKKSTAARRIGAFAKQTVDSTPRSETTESRRSFFRKNEEDDEDEEKTKQEQQKKDDITKEEPAEASPEAEVSDDEEIEAAKKEAATQQVAAELAVIESETNQTDDIEQNPVHAFLKDVQSRLESGEASTDPIIEQEAQKRLSLAEEQLRETSDEGSTTSEEEALPLSPAELPLEATEFPKILPLEGSAESIKPEFTKEEEVKPAPKVSDADEPPIIPPESDGSDISPPPGPPANSPEKPTFTAPELPYQAKESTPEKRTSGAGGALFLGGYIIGSRRGKKRVNAELKPKVKTLEGEVAVTTKLLESKEQSLRHMASALEKRKKQSAEERPAPTRSERASAPKPIERTSRKIVERAVTLPEQLQETLKATEQTRSVTPKAETNQARNAEPALKKPSLEKQMEKQPTVAEKIKRAEQLSTPELIKEAEHIYIDGASIRTLYNANRIDRAGLVKIVQESIRGGDINAAFKEVEVGRERQRERAKEFRHDDSHLGDATSDDSSQSAQSSQQLGRILMQDVRPASSVVSSHPKLNIPDTSPQSPDLDATHQDTPVRSKGAGLTLTIIAAIAIFFGVAAAIILLS